MGRPGLIVKGAQDAATASENLMVLNEAKSFIEFFACFLHVFCCKVETSRIRSFLSICSQRLFKVSCFTGFRMAFLQKL